MRPGAEPRLRSLMRAGKIQVGPWYVLADSFLVSGESLIRNLEIGMVIARRFGRPLDVGYLPDQFGHIAQMPQILAGFGFTTAVLWRGVGADVNRNRFTWEALDGSSVLTVYLPNGYSNGANLPLESVDSFVARAEQIAHRERDFAAGSAILVMNGTDHAPPDARLSARINEAREISAMTFETGSLENYVRRIAELPLDGTPQHRGELRSPLRSHLLPGVTSARTWIKQRDFENCRALERDADPLAALANRLRRVARAERAVDADMPAAEFKSIIGSLSQPSVFGRTINRYEIATAPDGRPQVNLFMSRAAFSDLDLEEFRHVIRTRIPDSGPVQIHATSAARCNVTFVADDLVQTGFSFYRLVRDDSGAVPASPQLVESIENEFFRLTPT